MTDAPMASAPRKRVRQAKEGAYTRFLEWASLNMPSAWRLRLDVLLISYAALFLAAISSPVIFAWAAGPDDQGYGCQQFREGTVTEAAPAAEAPAAAPAFATVDEARAHAQAAQEDAQYYEDLAKRYATQALEPGASQDAINLALNARADANYYADQARMAAETVRNMESGQGAADAAAPAPAEEAPAVQGSTFDPARPCSGRAYLSSSLGSSLFLKSGHEADNSGNLYYSQGFNPAEQGWILAAYIILALGLSLVWAFLVARGTRLRDVVVRTNAPGFVPLALGLFPFVALPMLAGFMTFAASHGFSFESMFLGQANVAGDGSRVMLYFPTSGYGASTRDILLTFGIVLAGFIAMSLKVVLYDGVVGLIRAIAIASAMGAVTFFSAFGAYSIRNFSGTGDAYGWAAGVSLLWGVVYVLAFLKDVPTGVRRRTTRPIALSFPFYLLGWSLQLLAFMGQAGMTPWMTSGNLLATVFAISLAALIICSLVFSFVARISLWPRPN